MEKSDLPATPSIIPIPVPPVSSGESQIPKFSASRLVEASESKVPETPPVLPVEPAVAGEVPVSDVGQAVKPEAGPVYFEMGGGTSVGEDEEPPELPPSLPASSSGLRVQGEVDPEFANLPDAPGIGVKLAMYSIICSVLGLVVGFLPLRGISFVGSSIFFLLAFAIAVGSFFKKPSVVRSILALLFSLLFPVIVLGFTIFFGVKAVIEQAGPELKGQLEAQADARKREMLAKEGVDVSALPKPGVVLGVTNTVVPVPPTESGVVEANLGEGKVPEVLMPPEQRPSKEPEVVVEEELEVVLPPEKRGKNGESLSESEFLKEIWWEIERGLGPGAPAPYRRLADKASDLLGYPLPVFEKMEPSVRLYLLKQKLSEAGVELVAADEADSLHYGRKGDAAAGSMGSVAKSDPGPGPLPASRVVAGMFSPDVVKGILVKRKYGTTSDGVGKFSAGMKDADLKKLLEEGMGKGTRVESVGGGFVITSGFGRQVGWDASGMAATKVQMAFNADGTLQDAYPF